MEICHIVVLAVARLFKFTEFQVRGHGDFVSICLVACPYMVFRVLFRSPPLASDVVFPTLSNFPWFSSVSRRVSFTADFHM